MQRYTSKATSINSRKAPAIYSMPKAISIMCNKTVIDIGGGRYDTAIPVANQYQASVSIYDKYNRSVEHNSKVLENTYDVAVISNVLNVIDNKVSRAEVIALAAAKANTILITVYEGDKSSISRQTGADSWQENRPTADYMLEISETLPYWSVCRYGKLIVANKPNY